LELRNEDYKNQVTQMKNEIKEQKYFYSENMKKMIDQLDISRNEKIDYIPEMIPPEQTYKIFFRN